MVGVLLFVEDIVILSRIAYVGPNQDWFEPTEALSYALLAKILSISEAVNKETKMLNYAYTTHAPVYTKYYKYEVSSAESTVSLYAEYLAADENFEITQQKVGEVLLNKAYEKDTLNIEIKYSQGIIEIDLVYTYGE